jgi:hypothetical protein
MWNWLFGLPGWNICEQSPWCQRKLWACSWLCSSPISPISACPELSMSFKHQHMAHAFFPENLYNHSQGLCSTSSEICIKLDAHSLPDPSRNRIRPDIRLQLKGCKKLVRSPSSMKFCTLTPKIC